MSSTNKQSNYATRSNGTVESIFLCNEASCVKRTRTTAHHQLNTMRETEHPLKRQVICRCCGTVWFICTACKKRFNTINYHRANKHFSKMHNIVSEPTPTCKQSSLNINEIEFDFNCTSDISSISAEYAKKTNYNHHHDIATTTMHQHVLHAEMSDNHKAYFTEDIVSPGKGFQQLVAKSVLNSSQINTSKAENLYHLDVAKFCTGLNHSQQEHFARIMQQTSNPETFTSTRPPNSLHDIRSFYTTSKTSIFNLLPSPTIHTTQNHTYVTLTSVIDYFLAYGHTTDSLYKNDDVSTLSGVAACKQANMFREEVQKQYADTNPMILYLLFWSDDFEGAMLRKNKRSVWIKTVTICPPRDQVTSTKYTYVVGIGRKGPHHDEINKLHNKELHQLHKCTYRYYGAKHIRQNVPVIVKTMAVLADRPERCSINSILQHNGSTTKRWRYAGSINQDKFPSCPTCFKKRITNINTYVYNRCHNCCDWNYNATNLHIRQPPPDNYPTCQHQNSPEPPCGRHILNCEYLLPIEQTYEIMIAASKFCAFNFWTNTWSKTNVIAYMKSVGISELYYKPYIIDVHNKQTCNEMDITDKINNFHIPTMWNSTVELTQYIDTPMHLIFQGILKSVVEISFAFLTKHKKKQQFKSKVQYTMQQLKALQCSFCRMETFAKNNDASVSGWIAEHYVALSRCFVHIMSRVSDVIKPQDEIIIHYYELMIQSVMCVIYHIMSPSNCDTTTIDNYIKCFLQSVHYFEAYSNVYEQNESSFIWYSRGNFLSLLNLPDQIERFGSVRLYWEGSCERHIQYVKPLMTNMRDTTSYLALQLHKLQQTNMLEHMMDTISYDTDGKIGYERYSNMKIYTDIDHLSEITSDGEAFLCSYKNKNDKSIPSELFFVFYCKKNQTYHKINICCHDMQGTYICGQWYSNISLQSLDKSDTNCIIDKNELKKLINVVAIPLHQNENMSTALYAFVTETWLCRSCNGFMCLPIISKQLTTKIINI